MFVKIIHVILAFMEYDRYITREHSDAYASLDSYKPCVNMLIIQFMFSILHNFPPVSLNYC